jgi:hypothetical protein
MPIIFLKRANSMVQAINRLLEEKKTLGLPSKGEGVSLFK